MSSVDRRKNHLYSISMTRCDYDGVFYRVFCITLLCIAFAFTVILTNVFIDIDGLLSGKHKEEVHHDDAPIFISETNDVYQESKPEIVYQDTKREDNYEDDRNGYRNKRSIESPSFQTHLKNPKIKKILTTRLAQLLEQLDAEESEQHGLFKDKEEVVDSREILDVRRTGEQNDKVDDTNALTQGKHEDMLHLAMHNILLQGIIGHMDLMDVYKKVHTLIKHIEGQGKEVYDEGVDMMKPVQSVPENVEQEFFDEMVRCDRLHKEVEDARVEDNQIKRKNVIEEVADDDFVNRRRKNSKAPKMLIKTIIDITSLKDLKDNETNSDNVKGIIKLIYNGRSIKFKGSDDEGPKAEKPKEPINENKKKFDPENAEKPIVPDALLRKAVADYFKDLKITNGFSGIINSRRKISKRMKRNVKLRHHNQKRQKHTTNTPETKGKEEDELYVEIETHFDNKGITGEKKRKLIKDIVEKIQKAIHTGSLKSNKDGKTKHLHIKKRDQSPIEKSENVLINKILIPINQVVRRESHPMSKVVPVEHPVPDYADKAGSKWQKTYLGPHFFNPGKAINSGEMGQIDLDYKNVMKNGIPQRLQQPINTDGNHEPFDDRTYFDLGNLKFYIKELDGTGFSIGFNQYVGEEPDQDTINIFTGLKQLIAHYHQNYDEKGGDGQETVETRLVENPNNIQSEEISHQVEKRDVKKELHNVVRRSADTEDSHSNEYKIIFDNNFLPYDSYHEIYEDKDKTVSVSLKKEPKNEGNNRYNHNQLPGIFKKNIEVKDLPFMIDETLLDRKLKPSEIFGLASLLKRKKRSMNINKSMKMNIFSKVKPKQHSTYINTKLTKTKPHQFFITNKRHKRQAYDKIRIIAADNFPADIHRRSDEHIYVVSDENMAERERESPSERDGDEDEQPELKSTENFALVSPPFIPYDNRRIMPNYVPNLPNSMNNPNNFFNLKSRHNALMSKYPHIFMEEISRSKEDKTPTIKLVDSFDVPMPNILRDMNNIDVENVKTTPQANLQVATESYGQKEEPYEIKELFNAIAPKSNYKLTVKILPKNITGPQSGFKEVHTSINKSVSRNGLIYSSQVNVSEVSKIEKDKNITTESPIVQDIKDQQEKMKYMLKAHKMRIDEQLNHLQKEKQHIDSVISDKTDTDTIDVVLPLNPPRLLHLNKDEASQLISSALMKLHDTPLLNDLTANHLRIDLNTTKFNITVTTIKPTTTTVSTTKYNIPGCPTTEKTTPDIEKMRIIKTIQRNENLTNKILSKIDKNTEILESFLRRLADKFDPLPHTTESLRSKMDKIDYRYPKEWRQPLHGDLSMRQPIHEPFFHKSMPKLEVNKNDTHVSIPFVYAYQQPYSLNPKDNKPNSPVASVVYQGHIHTNANLNKIPSYNAKPVAENEFKQIPNFSLNNANLNKIPNYNEKPAVMTENGLKPIPNFSLNNANVNKISTYNEKPAVMTENEFKQIPVAGNQVNNQTYFIDDMENEYKLESSGIKPKTFMNTTRV